MRDKRNKRKIKQYILIVITVITVFFVGFTVFINYQMSLIPKMSFQEMLAYTTKNQQDAQIAVAIIQNDEVDISIYGENSKPLINQGTLYEIGSITKTMTSALLCQLAYQDQISMDQSIDIWFDSSKKQHYPTLKQILSHTSGYKNYYFESPMLVNFFQRSNDFYNIDNHMINNRIASIELENKNYDFRYSNFGMAVAGLIIEKEYKQAYTDVLEDYLVHTLALNSTFIHINDENDQKFWNWKQEDAYIAAGGLISTIDDMVRYVSVQLDDDGYLSMCHQKVANVNNQSSRNIKMGIRVDAVGLGWMIDELDDIIWHNGATSDYNSYFGFHKESNTAVIVLSNLSPNKGIPATVMGVRLLKDKLRNHTD